MNKDCSLPNNIFYDATFSVQKYRGMGKYINNFKLTLEEKFNLNCIGLLPGNIKNIDDKYYSFGFSLYFLWEQISLLIFRNRFFIIQTPSNMNKNYFLDLKGKVLTINCSP